MVKDEGRADCRYIDSVPPGKDLFAGKAQEQIAQSIAELMKNNDTKEKLIGLEGAWGSGKSNLITILEGLVGETHHVFTYDAWGHQEDLQRRAVLESLTEDLTTKEVVKGNIWKKKLKNLLARKRETNTKTIPRLSWAVIALTFVIVLTPIFKQIGEAFVGPVFLRSGEASASGDPNTPGACAGSFVVGLFQAFVKVIITAMPLLGAVILYLVARRHRKKKTGKPLKFSELFYVYKGKELEETTYVTISEEEPSVREFRKWMSELSKDLKKDLIVVFDNMDRLPPEKVKQLWSSIHTFFSEYAFPRIWAIVTFDRKHLKAAFGVGDVSDQFINKTFSVIFRVPPPVLTDWQKFFDMKFNDAFSRFDIAERDVVRRIFDAHHDSITPRDIIAFINEVVAVKKTVNDEIKLRYIAVFVATKKEILDNPVGKILNLSFLKTDEALFRSDKDLQDSIAALVYNVPLASASQVTLTREIETAIRDKNGKRLNELTQHIHFLDILEKVLQRGTVETENAAITVNELDKEFAEKDGVKKRLAALWNCLGEQARQIVIGEQKLTVAQQALIKNLSGQTLESVLTHWIDGICRCAPFDGGLYYEAVTDLCAYVKENKIEYDVFAELRKKKVTPEVFLSYLKKAQSAYKKYKLTCDEAELNNFIAEKLPDKLEEYSELAHVEGEYSFSSLTERIEGVLADITIENVSRIYALYKTVADKKPIKSIPDEVQIHNFIEGTEPCTEEHYDLIAMRLAKGRTFRNRGGISQEIINQTDEQLVESIAERIEYFGTYGAILLEAKDWNSQLLRSVAKRITVQPYGVSKINIGQVLPHFKNIYETIAVEPEELIQRLDGWSKSAKEKIDAQNITSIVKDVEFFEYAVEVDCGLSKITIEVFCEYLDQVPAEQWKEAFEDETSYLFNSTYWLLKGSKISKLPGNAISVYKDLLRGIAASRIGVPGERIGVFYEKINKNKLKSTFKDIRDSFIMQEEITPELFRFFCDKLLDHGKLTERAGDVTRRILTPVIDDDICLRWILREGEHIAEIINESGDDADDFRDKIRQKTETAEDEALLGFAEKIGVETNQGE